MERRIFGSSDLQSVGIERNLNKKLGIKSFLVFKLLTLSFDVLTLRSSEAPKLRSSEAPTQIYDIVRPRMQ